ncbi:MAG TPA: ATP-binding protein, partial [Actinomycetota bacterium]|nr:ATP-binding protein [Actinomycetota bacterium]
MSDVPVTDAPTVDWHEANKRSLAAEVAVVAALLERHAAPARPEEPDATGDAEPNLMAAEGRLQDVAGGLPLRSALDGLTAAFGLSSFERSVVVLCAGMDLEGTFAIRCAEAQGDPRRAYPTFGMALAALPDPHWSAITPAAPLRRWRLVDVLPGDSLTSSPLRIDERVLHHLTGIAHLDERLLGLVWPVRELGELVPSHHDAARRVAEIWSTAGAGPDLPIVQLWGQGPAEIEAVAAHACTELDIRCLGVRASDVPPAPTEREEFSRLWEREAVLSRSALLVDADRRAGPDEDGAARAAMSFVDGLEGLVMISSREPVPPGRRPAIRVRVARSTAGEQRAVWRTVLGPIGARLNGQLDATVAQFDLGVQAIRAVGAEVVGRLGSDSEDRPSDERVGSMVWEACRAQARTRLDDLAQRIEPAATWDDLVLPNAQDRLLREIALHVRQRVRVYETWGFARRSNGGLGISALFAGPSGTGKTMAAEVLANELRLDLHRIDLSQVVSKYIGETEKNLERVFAAAERTDAILFFDEADALFGKRSDVK